MAGSDPPALSGDTLTFRPARTLLCPGASPSSSANLHGQNHAGWRAQRAQCLAADWAPTRGLVVIRRPSYPPGRRRSREPDSLQRPPLWDPHGPDGHPASKSARLRGCACAPGSPPAQMLRAPQQPLRAPFLHGGACARALFKALRSAAESASPCFSHQSIFPSTWSPTHANQLCQGMAGSPRHRNPCDGDIGV